MSTIVVARKGATACIAVDSLTSFRYLKMASAYSDSTKIQTVGESFVATIGCTAHQLVLKSLFDHEDEPPQFRTTMEIFEYFREAQSRLITDYHLLPHGDKDNEYETNKLNLLIANPHGIFGMLSMREVYEYKRFWAMGSGGDFAIGAMFAVYDSALTAKE